MLVNCSLRLLLALLASGLIFALWPGLDLVASGLFFAGGEFAGKSDIPVFTRKLLQYFPFVILAVLLAGFCCAAFLKRPGLALLDRRAALFLCVAFVVTPGLIVNLGLKDHWGRPRPVHAEQFGGQNEFRAWWQAGGPCERNCSFVSGEVSMMATLAAPAMIAAPAIRAAALAAVAALTVASAILRLVAGGHFLSDVVMSALISWMLVIQLYGVFYRPHFVFWMVRNALLLQNAMDRLRNRLVGLQRS